MRPGRSQSGFTLIEVLIAMAVGVVLIYLLSETLTLAQTGWAQANLLGESIEREGRAASALRGALTQMLPPTPDGKEHGLVATADTLEFSTVFPQSQIHQGPMRARLVVEPTSPGLFALTMAFTPDNPTSSRLQGHTRLVLLDGLTEARLSYYYAGVDGLVSDPPGIPSLPELIVVSWTSSSQEHGELAVRPRVSLSGRCHLDLASGTCRAS